MTARRALGRLLIKATGLVKDRWSFASIPIMSQVKQRLYPVPTVASSAGSKGCPPPELDVDGRVRVRALLEPSESLAPASLSTSRVIRCLGRSQARPLDELAIPWPAME